MNVDRYIPPANSLLSRYVSSIWRVWASGAYSRETILPKGNFDLLFNLGDSTARATGRRAPELLLRETAYVAGVQTEAFVAHPQGVVYLVGVSLRMETCAALLPLRPGEVTDRIVEAAAAFDEMPEICDRLSVLQDFPAQCRLLIGWLGGIVRPSPTTDWIAHACRSLRGSPTDSRVAQLARDHRVSDRHLRRIFNAQMGVGPAQYVRLRRFVRTLRLMPRAPTLTQVAHLAHYYDHAHFCREFKAIAGMSPTAYRDRVGPVAGHLFTP